MRNLSIYLLILAIPACQNSGVSLNDDVRFIVLGPSLVEIMYAAGLADRIVGIDRFSSVPSSMMDIPTVGGYIDPSLERIVSLEPTSLHVVGESAILQELAAELDIPYYSYRFDNLDQIYATLDSLDSRYGGQALEYRERIRIKLDSLARPAGNSEPLTAMIVIYHEQGSSSMTVAGRSTFFADLLRSMGSDISAPETGAWPMVSAEGVLHLQPDRIICLYPGREDSLDIIRCETAFWTSLGFDETRVYCLFESYIMIPGGRLVEIAERLNSCLR